VIERFDGYIAQYLGDGLLVYFGYPQAHEDDAQRAVRAGLEMLDALAPLQARLAADKGIRLAVRLGIHTGLVVVGAMGTGERQEALAMGDTPNIAARLQGLAAPDTLVVSDATWHLVQGYFAGHDLGLQTLKGVETPIQVYRVLGTSAAQSRLDVASPRCLTPLVGREAEVTLLRERWAQARDGLGQMVLLSGEAGIGKSRLMQVLYQHVADEPHAHIEWRCSPYTQQSPLQPVIVYLHRLLRWSPDDTPAERLRTLEETLAAYGLALPEMVPLFAALLSLSLPERYPPLTLTPQRQRQKTLEALLAGLLAEATRQPVLFIVEDLHWIDPSTLEFLSLLIDQVPTARLLTLLTCRPEFPAPWGFRAHCTSLTLNRLPQPQVVQMIGRVAGSKALPPDVVTQIVAKTDGVPLFVEELTRMVLESGLLQEQEERYVLTGPLPPLAIPATLHDSLLARLDRLATVKGLVQLGATLGREFSYALLQAVAPWEEATVQRGLQQLVAAEFLYQRGLPPQAIYTFKHALIQDAAYQSLLKSTRQQYHQRIAQVLETHFPEIVTTQPELLAHHCTEAGLIEQAIPYWQQAGQRASKSSAHVEAVSHFTTGIELLKPLPETSERLQHAVTLSIGLGTALRMTKGQAAPEVEHAYTQAYAWAQQAGETPQMAQALLGLWSFYNTRSQLHTARECGETLLRLAQRADDPALAFLAHYALGATWFYLGAFPAARQHLEAGIARFTPDQMRPEHPGGLCHLYAVTALWFLGYVEQAVARLHAALALVHERSSAYSRTYAAVWASLVCQVRRDAPAVYEQAEVAVALATEHSFPVWGAVGTSFRGWAVAMQGQSEAGMAQVRQGITALRATGSVLFVPYLCTLLADSAAHLGHLADGLQALAEAHTLVEQQEERWWEAEICRLRGVLLLRQSGTPQAEAETWLQRALDVSRRQEAKSLELRAAMSLARLWQQQGKPGEAYKLLASIYGWFTEGFDTADLQEARALLAGLEESA
jgi:predicted ATPase